MDQPTPDTIREAARLLENRVIRTPTVPCPALSARTGATVYLKLENMQVTGAFKARGALVRLTALDAEARRRGVIAMSAGNHAQGVAWHAGTLGIPATIVMPRETPFTKVDRTRRLGAQVDLVGDSLAEAHEHALERARAEGSTYIPPYDDAAIMAGQGTVALEMLADGPAFDALIVPVGGGGLLGGMGVAAHDVDPDVRLYGAQAALYPGMSNALGGADPVTGGATLAEGIAVKTPGDHTLPLVQKHAEAVLTADENAIEAAMADLMENAKVAAEGAGAIPLAVLAGHAERFAGRTVGLVVSGGNVDARAMASVLTRSLVRAGRIARLRTAVPDRPGGLAELAHYVAENQGNIIEVYHQRLFHDVPLKTAEVDIVVETVDTAHVRAIVEALTAAGMPARVLSNTAGSHTTAAAANQGS